MLTTLNYREKSVANFKMSKANSLLLVTQKKLIFNTKLFPSFNQSYLIRHCKFQAETLLFSTNKNRQNGNQH